MQMKSKLWIFFLYLACFSGQAKERNIYKASLPAIKVEGFYAIDLPWQVIGEAQPDLSDIRILGKNGKETPYLVKEDTEQFLTKEFEAFPTEIKSKHLNTEILLETAGNPLSSFIVRIKNADVKKTASLQGSNDRAQWFAVKDRFVLPQPYNQTQTEAELKISFPLSDYKYYLLSIHDSISSPLNVVSVGRWNHSSYFKQNEWQVFPMSTHITDKEHTTEITLAYPYHYYFSKAVFFISFPPHYNRQISFFRIEPTERFRGKKLLRKAGIRNEKAIQVNYKDGYLSSEEYEDGLAINVNQYTDTLQMSIFNGDDLPLQIDSIKTYINRFYLVAYLLPDCTYTLTYGDDRLSPPVYDLSFTSYIPEKIEHLSVKDIQLVAQEDKANKSNPWIVFLKKYGIWIIIGIVILQILYMVKKNMK